MSISICHDLIILITTADEIVIKSNGSYDITLGKISASNGFFSRFWN